MLNRIKRATRMAMCAVGALTLGAALTLTTPSMERAHAAAPAKLTAEQTQSVQAISNYFNNFNYIQGDFIQVGPKGHVSQGLFFISKPGKLRFEYAPPNPFLVVSDGDYVIVANRKNEKSDFYPLSKTPLQLVLAPKVNLLQEANVVDVRRQDDLVAVTLEDKSAFVPGQLILVFDETKQSLVQWVIVDSDKNRTTISLSNVETGVAPDPKLFVFNAPRNIDTGQDRR
ncbi:outer membrane lipoprotein-sorting protein [Rhodoligotrophos appendicifer]|uniref:LolA family protein n=1 Tax=Rhodoligotrophos appendicifer TaxID=987056 RepID=UPI00117F8107|nr:outer membrane lipoprotein carrier protein LolA [Rhodoligotrophos appendicifer]